MHSKQGLRRSRLPDTTVSGFSRLKVVVGPAVIVEGNADAAGRNGDVMLRQWLYEWVCCGVGLGSRGIGKENGFFSVLKMPTALE
ncbi:hypothetical protein DEO72_LG8g1401 [Vigna unguiculata]|uniref:Uncharacterized protein n=1 Tax=Vigna unguiculata TaxID=3917 RepID=A0A4D6MU12_VIGUN|nr:hypothetical protein DEO72_LG8g1401 [Vigna unguiculata]